MSTITAVLYVDNKAVLSTSTGGSACPSGNRMAAAYAAAESMMRAIVVPDVPATVSEFEQGRQLYLTGHRLGECRTQEERDGWQAAESAGADAYYRAMMAQAVS